MESKHAVSGNRRGWAAGSRLGNGRDLAADQDGFQLGTAIVSGWDLESGFSEIRINAGGFTSTMVEACVVCGLAASGFLFSTVSVSHYFCSSLMKNCCVCSFFHEE